MAIDGFFINKLITELNNELLNSRMQKIFLNKSDIFIFNFYLKGKNTNLIAKLNSPFSSLFISDNFSVDKTLSSNFLITLNKHLSGYILTNISKYKNDRVIIMEFSGSDFLEGMTTKHLIFEFMGRYNNMILTKDNIIIDAYNKNVSTTNRSIVPKMNYEYFATTKLDFNNDYSNVSNELYLSTTYLGISPLLSKYLFTHQANLNLLKVNPTLNLDDNKFYWFDLFGSTNKLHFSNLSKLLEHLTTNSFNLKDNRYLNFLSKKILSSKKRLENLNEDLLNSKDNLILKDYGNYIYSSGLNLNSYCSEFISYDAILIKLDIKKTLLENALDFFKTYEKAKRSITYLEKEIYELENLITSLVELEYEITNNYLNSEEIIAILKPLGLKQTNKIQRKQVNKKRNILTINYNNALFYIGRNSLDNEYLINEIANKNDYWFHIKNAPGSHIILKGELNDLNLSFGSMLAAYFSKEKANPIVTINYTLVRNLKKIPNQKAYNVILKDYQSLNIKIDFKLLEQYLGSLQIS